MLKMFHNVCIDKNAQSYADMDILNTEFLLAAQVKVFTQIFVKTNFFAPILQPCCVFEDKLWYAHFSCSSYVIFYMFTIIIWLVFGK